MKTRTSSSPIRARSPSSRERTPSSAARRTELPRWLAPLAWSPAGPLLAAGDNGRQRVGLMRALMLDPEALLGERASLELAHESDSRVVRGVIDAVEETATGSNNSLRPDRVFSQPIPGKGTILNWFNAAAFTAPPVNQYGTASRGSIEGPGTVAVDASLSRTVALGETRSFEARVTATNVFNTVQYSGIVTTLNSQTFGQVTSAAAMRQLTVIARYRF